MRETHESQIAKRKEQTEECIRKSEGK